MNASCMMNKHAKLAALSSLLAALFSLPAQAGLYQYSFNDSGPIPQGGPVFSVEQTISGIEPVISSVKLILTFNDKVSLTGDSSGIEGLLDLGTESGFAVRELPTGSDFHYVSREQNL